MFQVKICHISDRVVYEGEVERAILPGVMGNLEIIHEHVAIVALLKSGEIVLDKPTLTVDKQELQIHQGLMRYDGEVLYVIVE